MHIIGVDFTCAPRPRKPITIAHGQLTDRTLTVTAIDACSDWPAFEQWLAQPQTWVGAFDFPFSLSRELVRDLGWPMTWPALVRHCARLPRASLRATFQAYCDARPAGRKLAHRATDRPAGSSPSMKWVNPPVAYMFQEGARRLLDAGVTVYGLHGGDPQRVALEGYPGLIARAVTRASYKSDERGKQTEARRAARVLIVDTLIEGKHPLGITLDIDPPLRQQLIDDGMADRLDAVLCAVAAAWASTQPRYGMPPDLDPLEGWTAAAPFSSRA
jgi:hypothetical protein